MTSDSPSLPADEMWQAVTGRDPAFDGRFVFAVRTTGIYCRPSCPSRRPLRRNVRFFAAGEEARVAGFRACRRCRPDEALARSERVVASARAYLAEHLGERVTLAVLSREVGMSPHHLQRVFTRVTGVSPRQYAAALRAERLKTHLRTGSSVSRASYDAGYGASSRAYEAGGGRLGMTPAAYRRGGRGVRIRYTFVPTHLGRLLVGATSRGVCAVMLGDDDAELERWLAEEYPEAERHRIAGGGQQDDDLRRWAGAVREHLDGARSLADVALDVGGTPLQQRVWQELRRIPRGETRSYGEIARRVGAPQATRAVASACARNPVAIVIPCHRVVRTGGGLGGYRWGIERKARLLAHERETSGSSAPALSATGRSAAPRRREARARR